MGNLKFSVVLLAVVLYLCRSVQSQITPVTIMNKASNTTMNANFTSELVVAVTSPDPDQQWYVYQWDATSYFIVVYDPDVNQKQVVTCPPNLGYNPVPATLAQAILTDDNTNTEAHFNILENSDGTVTYESVAYPSYVLDLQNGNPKSGTPILCWEINGVNGTNNQHWWQNDCTLGNCP